MTPRPGVGAKLARLAEGRLFRRIRALFITPTCYVLNHYLPVGDSPDTESHFFLPPLLASLWASVASAIDLLLWARVAQGLAPVLAPVVGGYLGAHAG
jgi:hypothetical protein